MTAGLAVCAVLLAAAVAASIWWWPFGGGGQRRPSAVAGMASTVSVGPSTTRSVTSPSPRPSLSLRPAAGPLDAARARAVLAGLDATRATAFARRDPALLTSVYASRSLLARDRAMLTSIVPSGCVLRGVHTQFSRLIITARSIDRVQLRVRTALAPSTLVCVGTASGRAAGTPPVIVQVELVRHGNSYRIAAEHRV